MKKTNLVLGMMLIMLLALSTGLMAQDVGSITIYSGGSWTVYQPSGPPINGNGFGGGYLTGGVGEYEITGTPDNWEVSPDDGYVSNPPDGYGPSYFTIEEEASAPTIQATNVNFTNVQNTQMTVNWTRGNGDKCAVFVLAGFSGNAAAVDNTTYTAETAFQSGTQIGSTGWYCVYNNTGTTVTVTNLTASTGYRAHVCEYNGIAGSELYNKNASTGNPANLDSTLPVTLSSFTAQFIESIPILCWTTQSETSNAGWNIYRGETNEALSNEEAYLLNLSLGLIPGAGSTSEPTDYSFEDVFPVNAGNTYFYWLESVDYSGGTENFGPISLTIPEDEWENPNSPEIPKNYGLHQNYPNPFNPNTEISFMLKESCIGELSIYNIKGQKI